MLRSGVRRAQPPNSNPSSSDSDEPSAATLTRRGGAARRRGRGGGHIGRQTTRAKRARTNAPDHAEDGQQEDLDDNDDNSDSDSDTEEHEHIDLTNYHRIGSKWGLARAENYLTNLKTPKNNRPSPIGLFEAQSIQAAYNLDKVMLCIVLKCSRQVLDEALMEGPLSRQPNMYTNYQTYSVAATTAKMPPAGVSEGFKVRNETVGTTWSAYEPDEQEIFTPRLFERLCVATSEAYALTQTPIGIADTLPPPPAANTKTGLEPLTEEEAARYIPVFERLVNLSRVSRDMHQGRLWRHSGKSRSSTKEQLIKFEVSKVVRQLHILNNQLDLQFHLLLASWNPGSSTRQALYQNEHTSCARWVRMHKKTHLLERFTFESTKAPDHLRQQGQQGQPKPLSESAARQASMRTQLAKELNYLIAPFLPGGYLGKGDAHPKCPDLKAAFAKKTFRGDIQLMFRCSPESRITNVMLSKGPGNLTNNEVEAWLSDIESERYTIHQVKHVKKRANAGRSDELTPQEAALDDSIDLDDQVPLTEMSEKDKED